VPFQKIASKKKSQLAAEMLLEEIRKKQFKVDERLPPERDIARAMGVSRNTLREAIAALQIIGILEARHSQGNFVIGLNVTEDMYARLEAVFVNSDDPFLAVDARIAFEPGAAFLACQTATDEDILDIGQIVGRVASAIQANDLKAYSQADHDFHLRIAQSTHNAIVIETIQYLTRALTQPLWQSMKRVIASENRIRKARVEEHEAIRDAIAARNPLLAQDTLRHHLECSRSRLVEEIENGNG
jgi:GntR family transcriptional regulator, transcriptional repressor for pyruvate dehydrogenase complex